jgi:hypothetical protein
MAGMITKSGGSGKLEYEWQNLMLCRLGGSVNVARNKI